MDCKKFMQLVEEKKKRVLEKKEAPLKWEQKLEAAAKAKEGKRKAVKHKRESVSDSDSESESNHGGRKKSRRSHKKHRKHVRCGSGDSDKKESKRRREPKKRSSSSSDDISEDFESDAEEARRKKRVHRRRRHHGSGYLDSSSDDDSVIKRSYARHHNSHKRTDASGSDISSSEDDCKGHVKRDKFHRRAKSCTLDSSGDYAHGAIRVKSHSQHNKRHGGSHSHHSSDSDGHGSERRSPFVDKEGKRSKLKESGQDRNHHERWHAHENSGLQHLLELNGRAYDEDTDEPDKVLAV